MQQSIRHLRNESWGCCPSAIITSELYDGEVYDMREEQSDWTTADPSGEVFPVKVLSPPSSALIATDATPVRVTEMVKPTQVLIASVCLPKDHKLSVVHAEVLDADGDVVTRTLRHAKCIDTVISSGEPLTMWQPKFTFHGFRYAQLEGWPGIPSVDDFTALVIHTDMKRRGWFSCSDPLVNKLHENVVWSMRGNFLSVPTDCSQRDERLGWTGDIQDLSAEQLATPHGIPGLVVPDAVPAERSRMPQALWHDAAILTPWDLYVVSGDTDILKRQYHSMTTWIDKAIRRGPDGLWDPQVWQLGDWLDPNAPPDDAGYGRTDGLLVADAYLVQITRTMASICAILDLPEKATMYEHATARLKAAFQHKYITPYGNLASNTQTAVSLALLFSLFPDDGQAQENAQRSLGGLARASKFRIGTGFAGTAAICHALSGNDRNLQLAYRMLLERHCPSWLYPVTMGATTIWERWDSMMPDGRVNPGEMTSFNHYALGGVARWLHDTVGGVSTTDGWRTVLVSPKPGGSIDHAEITFEGPYGLVKSRWSIVYDTFTLELTIPPNAKAEVVLPRAKDILFLGSGEYTFSCPYHAEPWPPKLTQESWMPVKICDCCV
ncbi:bacterial alpha-L-rhamnosidase-domain-containing protein [Aspergillus avenaceus]|uniref:alpha-L-rhamnosidase n=1 Tax=Aspergillus avenaceus TaxID=36643 RepID=A0A5N6TWL4_ASPAV|nr:bacterial alpha-L-rhamnosidase-domain-containing protein [Aspergillus avenaceus]